jgi:tetratricopeptide (TPR) repeat protein
MPSRAQLFSTVLISVAFTGLLFARDDQQLALTIKAQSDFDRVTMSVAPPLGDTATCAQSQAAVLSVSPPEDLALLRYRKGFCLLAGATVTGNRQDFAAAAAEFDQAIEAWPARVRKPVKNVPPEPVSSGLRALDALAHLNVQGEAAAQAQLDAAVANPSCSTPLMQEQVCRQWVEAARQWLGRIALRAGSLDQAAAAFSGSPQTGWEDWAQGKLAFETRNYAQAVSRFNSAIQTWKAVWSDPGPGFAARLGPRPDLAPALADLGGAQLLAGNPQAATRTLDTSLKADPASARTFFLRARARELAGHTADALADYNLAARAAFAASEDLASGEAHLYRGILLFRRKDYERAEDEFASALNFSIARPLRADAEAWRHLSAVATGSCVTARQNLERSLASVSPYFPKDEARAMAASCRTTSN